MRFLGIDPGLNKTGWGIIDFANSRLKYVSDGVIKTSAEDSISKRLLTIHNELSDVISRFEPQEVAIEEIFINKNPVSTLKLSQARGAAILSSALHGLQVFEYSPNEIKKTVVGTGHAAKQQIAMMIKVLLPEYKHKSPDSADALAAAICHAHSAIGKIKKSGVRTLVDNVKEAR
ncbi:MAG: crossover junction endodeoxyribonuclease RuvC [Alphaproteobacteria bacterium]